MPGKFYIVGAGLSADLISLKAVKILKNVDLIFIDMYTSILLGDAEELKKYIGAKEFIPLRRSDVEEKPHETIFKHIESGLNVAFLVPGNPLDATTHASLVVEAWKKGIDFEIIPAPGIIPNAVSMSGLMIYKVGKVVTLTFPKHGIYSEYPYDVIKDNDLRNLHTLLLLDLDLENNKVMQVSEAVDLLYQLENLRREGVISPRRLGIAVSGLGGPKQRICFDTLEKLRGLPNHDGPNTLIITSPKLHFMEEEVAKVISNVYCR